MYANFRQLRERSLWRISTWNLRRYERLLSHRVQWHQSFELHWREQLLSHHSLLLPQIPDCTTTEFHLDVEPTRKFKKTLEGRKKAGRNSQNWRRKLNKPVLTNLECAHCICCWKYRSYCWITSITEQVTKKLHIKKQLLVHDNGVLI